MDGALKREKKEKCILLLVAFFALLLGIGLGIFVGMIYLGKHKQDDSTVTVLNPEAGPNNSVLLSAQIEPNKESSTNSY